VAQHTYCIATPKALASAKGNFGEWHISKCLLNSFLFKAGLRGYVILIPPIEKSACAVAVLHCLNNNTVTVTLGYFRAFRVGIAGKSYDSKQTRPLWHWFIWEQMGYLRSSSMILSHRPVQKGCASLYKNEWYQTMITVTYYVPLPDNSTHLRQLSKTIAFWSS